MGLWKIENANASNFTRFIALAIFTDRQNVVNFVSSFKYQTQFLCKYFENSDSECYNESAGHCII